MIDALEQVDTEDGVIELGNARFLTFNTARKRMRIAPNTLQQMIADGQFETFPSPRHKQAKLLREVDVDAWLRKAGKPLSPRLYPEHRRSTDQ